MMDHLFDFIFAGALVAGWVFLVPDSQSAWVVVTMLAWAGSMVNSFLYLAATNDFKVSYAGLGPTEFRVVVIVGYIVAYLWGPSFFSTFVPVIAVGSLLVLAAVLYDSHTSLWQLDMHAKPSKKKSNTGYGRIKA